MNAPIERWLTTPGMAFAVGVRGVIAEFPIDEPLPALTRSDTTLSCVSATGAIAINMRANVALTMADEALDIGHAEMTRSLTHRLTLPRDEAAFDEARGLRELGPDRDAVQADAREQVRFDMGLGIPHLRACVRTDDAALIATLRQCLGEDMLARDARAMAAVKAASPTRVFESRLARIEVYQPIPSRARGERTPHGAHTHVLPALLDAEERQQDRVTVLQIFEPAAAT